MIEIKLQWKRNSNVGRLLVRERGASIEWNEIATITAEGDGKRILSLAMTKLPLTLVDAALLKAAYPSQKSRP